MKHIFFIHPENKRSKLKKEEAQLAVAFLQPGPLVSLFLFCMTYRNRNCQNGSFGFDMSCKIRKDLLTAQAARNEILVLNHHNIYQGPVNR